MYGADLLSPLMTTTTFVPWGPRLSLPLARSCPTDPSCENCTGSNTRPLISTSESARKFSPRTQSFLTPFPLTPVTAGNPGEPPVLSRTVTESHLESTRAGFPESITCAAKEDELANLGTPSIEPVGDRLRPEGSAPPTSPHL